MGLGQHTSAAPARTPPDANSRPMKFFVAALFLLGAIVVAIRAAIATYRVEEKRKNRLQDMEKWKLALRRDPNNAGAHGQLAEILVEDGQYAAGAQAYETALSLLPHGPFSAKWRHSLKKAQDLKEAAERARAQGQKPPSFEDWNVCNCGATVSSRDRKCYRCGHPLHQDFAHALTETNILRMALPFMAWMLFGFLLLSLLPQWCMFFVVCVLAIVAFVWFRRS